MFLRRRFGVALASPNRQGAIGGTFCETTRLRLAMASALWPWRPEVVDLASESSQIVQGGRHTGMAAAGNRERGRKEQARGKASRARGRLAAHGERSAGEIREERRALAGRPTCSRTRAPAPPVEAAAAEPSLVPHPREEQPPAGCCFPAASSGPLSSRRRAASPLPSLFPTRAGADADEQVFPPPPLVLHRAGAGPEPPPSSRSRTRAAASSLPLPSSRSRTRAASSSLPLPSSRSRTPSSQVILCFCSVFL
jgi:hypothetical protein